MTSNIEQASTDSGSGSNSFAASDKDGLSSATEPSSATGPSPAIESGSFEPIAIVGMGESLPSASAS